MIHTPNRSASPLSGQVLGLFPFAISDLEQQENWMRGGVEVEQRLWDIAILSAVVNVSSTGADPIVSGGVSLKVTW